MVKVSRCNCLCFAEAAIDVISKRWSLLVVNALGNHQVLRYKELMKELSGISPKALADTLARLCKEGLVWKESFAEIPPRVQYSLTDEGKELRKAMKPLLRWALTRGSNAPTKCVPKYRKARAHILRENNAPFNLSEIDACSRDN